MPRGRDRYEIRDFSYGMDSTSYPGVISEEKSRMPQLYNWRVRENGRLIRRGGYQIVTTDSIGSFIEATHETVDLNLRQKNVYYSTSTRVFKLIEASLGGVIVELKDAVGAIFRHYSGNNFTEDKDGHIYTSGPFTISTGEDPHLIKGGAIIDRDRGIVRNWGIAAPLHAAFVQPYLYGDPYDDIPAPSSPTDKGWYYFYTYVNIYDGELHSESAPSPVMSSRFAPDYSCEHEVQVDIPTDPQVTHIRLYRTTGEETGLEDGTSIDTTGFVKEVTKQQLISSIGVILVSIHEPASIVRLLDTFDSTCYGEYVAGVTTGSETTEAKRVLGRWVLLYKDQILTYGYDNRVYYTPNRIELKWKSLFTDYATFDSPITGAFVFKNDIILCTANQTWRVPDGNWTQIRLQVDRIGVIANNSAAFDPSTNRQVALTNKGIRAFDGNEWSDDLSYQIKAEIETTTKGLNATGAYLATGAVINREYILSFRGDADGSTDALTLVGFLHTTGAIAWSIDRTQSNAFVMGSIMTDIVGSTENRTPYNEYPFAIMRVINRTYLVQIGLATDYDFGDERIECRITLPRLIHNSLDNNVRPRYMKIIGTLALPNTTAGEVPQLNLKATGDSGRSYQRVVVTQDVLDGPLDKYKYTK